MNLELIFILIVGAGVPIGEVAFIAFKTRHERRDALKVLRSR